MKKKIIYYYILTLFASCNHNKPIIVKQNISNELVTLFKNVKNGPNKNDSLSITIPTEFEITLNSSKVRGLSLYYILNKRRLTDDFFEYQVYNKNNKIKPIYSFDSYLQEKSITIIIKERNHLISKYDANALLKKYNIKQSVNNLKFGDTIKLIPFNQLIKENKKILSELNKVNDSLFFRVTLNKGKVLIIKQKINW
ncbi:hypothetical protein [Flavobacterium sp.]|uniref:hypothetical protein n=1 Tax=Flavobacterium sp. TaxID=239 RepID=UPI003D0F81BA